jgi:hypothetical protein
LLRGVESKPCLRLLRSAEPAQFGAFREPMATVVPPDEAETSSRMTPVIAAARMTTMSGAR